MEQCTVHHGWKDEKQTIVVSLKLAKADVGRCEAKQSSAFWLKYCQITICNDFIYALLRSQMGGRYDLWSCSGALALWQSALLKLTKLNECPPLQPGLWECLECRQWVVHRELLNFSEQHPLEETLISRCRSCCQHLFLTSAELQHKTAFNLYTHPQIERINVLRCVNVKYRHQFNLKSVIPYNFNR